jgi:hypothetical protein
MNGVRLEGIAWSAPEAGLRLGVGAADPGVALLRLQNIGAGSLEVLSHMAANGKHLDWFTLVLRGEGPDGAVRRLALAGDRDRSTPVRARLGAGEFLEHRVAVDRWAADAANGGEPLPPGPYRLVAVYQVDGGESGDHWRGRLEAGPVALDVAPPSSHEG